MKLNETQTHNKIKYNNYVEEKCQTRGLFKQW